jgi:DNA/RNA-binding domain of Phe-tRNA-synthetase-like protein
LDLEATSKQLILRYGKPGEKFVFNHSGHEIDLNGLICVCKGDTRPGVPIGTPVKDSMVGKISESTRSVIGIIYSPRNAISDEQLNDLCGKFENLLKLYAEASTIDRFIA